MTTYLLIKNYSMKNFLLFVALGILMFNNVSGQTPGMIYEPATGGGGAVLDPNGDGYTSILNTGFTSNDETESEIPYVRLVFPSFEPSSDLGPGPNCGFTDFVDQPNQDPCQNFLDLDNNWLYRFRMGGTSPNSKSYSVLIDIDQKFGATGPNADPNYTVGNPGFEIELVLATNFGVYIYNVDGKSSTNPPVLLKSYAGHTNYQKSIALTQTCGDPDYFYDFYIPFSDLTTYFGITTSTPLRFAIIDNMAAQASAIGQPSSLSDLGGVDDAACGLTYDLCFGSVIDNYTPCGASTSPCPDRSACPGITGPVNAGVNSVSGTSAEADGTIITVYKNGTSIGTTSVTSGSWTFEGFTPLLAGGDIIEASATAAGEGESYRNCSTKIVDATCSANPTSATHCGKSIQGVAPVVGALINIYQGITTTPINPGGGTIFTAGTPNSIAVTTLPSSLNPTTQNFLFKCTTDGASTSCNSSGPACLTDGAYRITAKEAGKCESPGLWICVGGNAATGNPTISTDPVLLTTTSISGSVTAPDNVAGVTIYLYSNGTQLGTATTGTGGAWTISGLSLTARACETLSVIAIKTATNLCPSTGSVTKTIQRKAYPPIISGPLCSLVPITSVSGTSVEAVGTTIEIFEGAVSRGTTTVASGGSWTKSGISIALGSTVTAKAYGTCLAISDASNAVVVGTKSTNAVSITSSPLYECGASVTGTGTDGDIITLYEDGFQIGTTAVVSGGTWTIGGLNTNCYLYTGGVITARAYSPGKCEGDLSGSVIVICVTPSAGLTVNPSSTAICPGSAANVTVLSSESGVVYQLYNGGVSSGSSKVGTGGSITLTSAALNSPTTLTVKAFRIGTSCSTSLSNSVSVSLNSGPSSSVLAGSATICNSSSANLTVTITGGLSPYSVSVNNGVGTINNYISGSNILVTPVSTTTYELISVSDANSCASSGLSGSPTITVSTRPSNNPLLSSDAASVCSGQSTNINVPTANDGYSYQVYQQSDNSAIGTSFTGNGTSFSRNTGSLTVAETYYVSISNGSCSHNGTSMVTVTVDPASAGGSVSGGATVCSGTNSTLLTLSGQTGTVVKWQFSTNGGSVWTDISHTGTTYTVTDLSVTTQFRAVVQSGSCASANSTDATVAVIICAGTIDAIDDAGSAVNGYSGGTSLFNVLTNDILNSAIVNPADISIAFLSSTNTGITLSGTDVVVAAGTPAGTYTLVYQVCEILNPSNCDQASVSVIVTAAPILANDDAGSANGISGGTAIPSVLANDQLNGNIVLPSEVSLTVITPSGNAGVVLNPTTGEVTVAPGTVSGIYTITYKICEILNPTNCDQAIVTITVDAAAIIAGNDAGSLSGVSGGTAVNDVLVNDSLNGNLVLPSEVTLSFISTTNAGVTLVGNDVIVAPGTPAGIYLLVYQICEILNPTNCGQATVTVTVTNDPPVISGGITFITNEDNPVIICIPITDPDAGSVFTASFCGGATNGTLSAPVVTGNQVCVTYTPDPEFNGPDQLCLQICDNGTPPLCDTAVIYINVLPVNDPPVVFNENVIMCNNGTTFSGNILDNGDSDPDGTVLTVATTPIAEPLNGTFTILPNGDYTYTPTVSFAGNDMVVIALCDNGMPLPSICRNDTINITVVPSVVVYAGPDDAICQTVMSYPINGATAQNATGYLWTSSGTGTFDNAALLNSVYSPSVADFAAGSVSLTITGYGTAPCSNMFDSMVLNFSQPVTVNAGQDGITCQGMSFTVTTATALDYTSLLWTASGAGSLLNATSLTPTYIPTPSETGNVILTLTAYGVSGCASGNDQMMLSIMPAAVAVAGPDANICENQGYSTSNASAAFYNSLLWTSSGTGTFADPMQLATTYSPSSADISAGSVVLTLTSYGSIPCGNATDNLILSISKAPSADAGADASTCQGEPYTVSGASTSNSASVLWTHNGQGTLSGASTLTPTYAPATGETGVVLLTLTATGTSACGNSTSGMNLTIFPAPFADAGTDQTGCGIAPFILSNASASGAETLLWTTSGTGTFSNPAILNTTYNPSISDVTTGAVNLTLTVNGFAQCGTVNDNLTLTLATAPLANAGPDRATCSSVPFAVEDASASGYSSLVWTHNGLGTITGANTTTPAYLPANGESGVVTLTLTLTGNTPCGDVSDNMMLNVIPAIVATAGQDMQSCEMMPVVITGANAQNYSSVLWTSSGNGTFNDPTLLNPVYVPSASDVSAGMVILTMHLAGIAPCETYGGQVKITLAALPTAKAGNDAIICNSASYTLGNTSATNYSSLVWEFTPVNAGTLTNTATLNPTFTPAPSFTGVVSIKLRAYGNTICNTLEANDVVLLTIVPGLSVSAGTDEFISAGTATTLHSSVSGGTGVYAWSWEPSALLINNNVSDPQTLALDQLTAFSLTVLDITSGCSAQDTVVISVVNLNQPPIAVDDKDTTDVNTPVTIKVLPNDSDPDGDPLSVSLCGAPANGVVIQNQDNTFSYTPYDKFIGDDQFCYTICDNGKPSLCDTAIVYIHIKAGIDDLVIYNLLTPDGDNSNDKWYIRGIEDYPDNTIVIFNRWGDKVCDFSRYDNINVFWDGSNKRGEILPSSTYFYILKINNVGSRTGWIYIRSNEE